MRHPFVRWMRGRKRRGCLVVAASVIFVTTGSCGFGNGSTVRSTAGSPPRAQCEPHAGARAAARGAIRNLPLPAPEIERLMAEEPFEIREHEWKAGWRWRVYRIEAYYPSLARTLSIKWKAASEGLEARNNTPRREIAAYEIQKWFVDADDYVVPPTRGLCLPLAVYAEIDAEAEASLPGTDCVFGTQAIWLQNVEAPDPLIDEDRFRQDAAYARHLVHYNILTYLIENHDTRPANVLVSTDRSNRRVFSIDNGVSFGEPLYNVFRSHWDDIRVPALTHEAIERLRDVGERQLRALAVIAEFEIDARGVLRERPVSSPFDEEKGVRTRGRILQLGLEPEEIEGVRKRLRGLLAAVDREEIPLAPEVRCPGGDYSLTTLQNPASRQR